MIVNILNDKVYIGSASNFRFRRKHHRHYLNTNCNHNKYLQRSWNKYGQSAFIWTILERVEDKSKLDEIEQKWLNVYNCFAPDNGYNIRTKAENNLGVKHTDETKKKMSLTRKGRKITEKQKGVFNFKGKKHTKESRAKMSASRAGKKRPNTRDFKNWPHEDARKCKCIECMAKKAVLGRYYHSLKREKKISYIMLPINTINFVNSSHGETGKHK